MTINQGKMEWEDVMEQGVLEQAAQKDGPGGLQKQETADGMD